MSELRTIKQTEGKYVHIRDLIESLKKDKKELDKLYDEFHDKGNTDACLRFAGKIGELFKIIEHLQRLST